MLMIEPVTVAAGQMTASTIPENDYAAWSGATTYALGARVIKSHRIWESVQGGNLNHDPDLGDAAWWLDVGATNRWRAFDGQLQPLSTLGSTIQYTLTLTKKIDAIALFGLVGATVRILIKDGAAVTQYDQTFQLASERIIAGWWDWFFEPFSLVQSLIVQDLPGFVGWSMEITIDGAGTLGVGEILIGKSITLGTALVGTQVGFRSYSIKEVDEWGGFTIVKRGFSRTVDYQFSLDQVDVARVQAAVLRNRDRMCVFSAGEDTEAFGTTVLGFVNSDGLSIPITTNICFATLSVEGLTEE